MSTLLPVPAPAPQPQPQPVLVTDVELADAPADAVPIQGVAVSPLVVCAPADEDLELPPLPRPRVAARRAEAWCGIRTVLAIIGAILAITHGVLLNGAASRLGPVLRSVVFWLVHAEALVALVCLERILRGDAGVVRRTPASTKPLPAAVADRIRSGRSLDGLRNVTDPRRGSFCVRCCVWRPVAISRRCHHCRICNRCVRDFDHHCGFYGRCIAGTRTSGNVPYFITIAAVGQVAFFTVLVFLILSQTRWGGT